MYAKNIRSSAKRDDRIVRPRRAQTCERSAWWECAREAARFFNLQSIFLKTGETYQKTIKHVCFAKLSLIWSWHTFSIVSRSGFLHLTYLFIYFQQKFYWNFTASNFTVIWPQNIPYEKCILKRLTWFSSWKSSETKKLE